MILTVARAFDPAFRTVIREFIYETYGIFVVPDVKVDNLGSLLLVDLNIEMCYMVLHGIEYFDR